MIGKKALFVLLTTLFLLLGTAWNAPAQKAAPQTGSTYETYKTYEDLVRLFKEFREFQKPKIKDGVPDYTPAAMREQRRGLEAFKKHLAAIDPSIWPISQRVDYLLVRAEMNGLDFDHRVLRPWSRDPAWYIVVEFQFGLKMHDPIRIPRLPLPADRLTALSTKLQAVPKILEQAKKNLTEPAADLVMLGIRSKQRENG